MSLKYIIIVIICLLIIGCGNKDEWCEVKRTTGIRQGSDWATLIPWSKPTVIVVEENQSGNRRMYSITATGGRKYLNMEHEQRFFGEQN